jgi:transcriptional regulator with XRE-family HTH domain
MPKPDAQLVGERIAYHRKRMGLSQVEFAALVNRSESWVSQVERGVRPVDRMSVLQHVADVLSVSVAELQDDEETPSAEERPQAFDTIRLALTGHPAIGTVLGTVKPTPSGQIETLRDQHEQVWELVHASRYTELAPILAELIPALESAVRTAASEQDQASARDLLGDTYQAAAAMLAKLGETDAAWIAADRAAFIAEAAGAPLDVAASMFRMAHVFLALGQIDQAHHVATAMAEALEPKVTLNAEPGVLSLYGGAQLVLAVAAARDNQRTQAHQHLKAAETMAAKIGEDRDDYGTEFGPTNVAIHAVSIAVELGDAGQAIDLAQRVNAASLSPERQARFLLDLAQAHAMRRQIGESLYALQEAERIAPEETRVHYLGRAVTRDLLQLSGLRPRPELRDLAERFGVLP